MHLENKFINIFEDDFTWKEAAVKASKPLLDYGYVNEEFVSSIIKYVEEYGPYIVLAPHIALFHAKPEDGVSKQGITLSIFKKGVVFNNTENDPVYLVFVLAPISSEAHIEMLAKVSEILTDENKIKNLIESYDKEEIKNIFES